jgi:hypothetical protein
MGRKSIPTDNTREQVYARTETKPDSSDTPFMRLLGSGTRFLFGFGETGEKPS